MKINEKLLIFLKKKEQAFTCSCSMNLKKIL